MGRAAKRKKLKRIQQNEIVNPTETLPRCSGILFNDKKIANYNDLPVKIQDLFNGNIVTQGDNLEIDFSEIENYYFIGVEIESTIVIECFRVTETTKVEFISRVYNQQISKEWIDIVKEHTKNLMFEWVYFTDYENNYPKL